MDTAEKNNEKSIQDKKVNSMDKAVLEWLNLTRIDIKNQGEGNDVTVTVLDGENSKVTRPRWFSKEGIGYVVETSDQHLLLELECHGAGNMRLYLRGIDRRAADGSRIPLWVDYTRLAINEEEIFGELKPQWHDRAYKFDRQVEDGEKIKVEISWSLHGYKGEELARLISLCSGHT